MKFSMINDHGIRVVEPGEFTLYAGGKQPGYSPQPGKGFTDLVEKKLRVTGKDF
ncbi:MAG: hypothetical protein R2727_11950 [Bacteroidales bacterium]